MVEVGLIVEPVGGVPAVEDSAAYSTFGVCCMMRCR